MAAAPGPPSHPDYTCERTLGRGQYGVAYLMKPLPGRAQEPVVIKQVNLAAMAEAERTAAQKEIDVLKMFEHHNIVAFIDSAVVGPPDSPVLSIMMEYANGGSLQQYLGERKKAATPLPEEQVCDWLVSLLSALVHIHSKNVLHRDIKTANVFLHASSFITYPYPQIKLGDFGIARVLSNDASMASTVCGTPYYLSPELVNGQPYNAPSDVWALGVLMYELTCFVRPFEGTNIGQVALAIVTQAHQPFPPSAGYSAELEAIVGSMLEKDSSKRARLEEDLQCNPYIIAARERHVLRKEAAYLAASAAGLCEDAEGARAQHRPTAEGLAAAYGGGSLPSSGSGGLGALSGEWTRKAGQLAPVQPAPAQPRVLCSATDSRGKLAWAAAAAELGGAGEAAAAVGTDAHAGAFVLAESGRVVSWRLGRASRSARSAASPLSASERLFDGERACAFAPLAGYSVHALACCSASAEPRLVAAGVPAGGEGEHVLLAWEQGAAAATPLRGLPPGRPVLKLACGNAHCVAIVAHAPGAERGDVYAWGRGAEGQLGHSIEDEDDARLINQITNTSRGLEQPLVVASLDGDPVVDVACGPACSAAVLDDGTVLTWGANESAQLGHPIDRRTVWTPEQVALPDDAPAVLAVACGAEHMAALGEDGRVLSWGRGSAGQLGREQSHVRSWPWGEPDLIEWGELPAGARVERVACAGHLTAAVLASGEVAAWGRQGRFDSPLPALVLAAPPAAERVTDVAAAEDGILLLVR